MEVFILVKMGFGIFKKIKQGLTKISDFGKKALKSVMDNAPKVINTADKIVKSGIADKALERLNIDKNKLLQNMNNVNEKLRFPARSDDKIQSGVNFAGRSWRPKFN